MNEQEARKKINHAMTEKLSFLDGLPSQEKKILERIPTEDEDMTIAYRAHATRWGWKQWMKPLAAACAMIMLMAGIGIWANGANRPDMIQNRDDGTGILAAATTGTQEGTDATAGSQLDRIDLYVDPALLWDSENGLLVEGENAVKKRGILPFTNTVYRRHYNEGTTLDGEIVYSSGEKGTGFRQAVKLQLGGDDYGLDMPQKSFLISSAEGTFEYALFDDRPYTSYKTFLLSNADADCMFTRVADPVQHRMIDKYLDTGLLTLAWRPVNVYINNEYQGIYNMREELDAYTVCRHEGLPDTEADSVTLLNVNGGAYFGSNKEFKAMLKELKTSDPANNPEDLAYLEEQVDIESFLEWLAVSIYYGNSDGGTGVKYYRIPEGKWKCAVHRLHYGLYVSDYNSLENYLKEEGMGAQKFDNTVFLKILAVDQYRELFLQKLGNLYRTLNTETMRQELDACVAWIMPDMRAHVERWGPYYDKNIIQEVPTDADGAWKYWQKRVTRMHNVMTKRPNYVYQYTQSFFGLSDEEMEKYFGPKAKQGDEILSTDQVFGKN